VKTEISTVEEHNSALRKAIERRAYALYQPDGLRHGHDDEHWYRAEQELTAQDVPLLVEDGAVTVRIATEHLSPSALIISISARSVLILSIPDDTSDPHEDADREQLRSISLPAEVDPEQVTCTMDNGELTLKLPRSKAFSSAAHLA
jgi:hypothetical protein